MGIGMEELHNKLIETVNASSLPLEAKRYVVKVFAMDVEETFNQAKKLAQTATANDEKSSK